MFLWYAEKEANLGVEGETFKINECRNQYSDFMEPNIL
jgi:hypothetical protein